MAEDGDCHTCPYKKGMANPKKGKKLPGIGKCIRPAGLCEAYLKHCQEETDRRLKEDLCQ